MLMRAVKLCTNQILQFWTEGAAITADLQNGSRMVVLVAIGAQETNNACLSDSAMK